MGQSRLTNMKVQIPRNYFPISRKQQLIVQYVININFMFIAIHAKTLRRAQALDLVFQTFSLEINNSKSMVLWIGGRGEVKLEWTQGFN